MFIIFVTLQYNSMIKIVWEKKFIEIFIIIIIIKTDGKFVHSINILILDTRKKLIN